MTRAWSPDDVRALGVRTDIVTAGQILGVGRGKAYELARTGSFPCPVLRVGTTYVVPVSGLLDVLGITPNSSEAGTPLPALATTDPDERQSRHEVEEHGTAPLRIAVNR